MRNQDNFCNVQLLTT